MTLDPGADVVELPAIVVRSGSLLTAWWEAPLTRALTPTVVVIAIAPLVYWFFRATWEELDREAKEATLARTGPDYTAAVALVLLALTLTIQEYYGGRAFYQDSIEPYLMRAEKAGWKWLQVAKFRDLYGYYYWALSRMFGYALVPVVVFKVLFPKMSILDMGLRLRGFRSHIGLYALSLAAVFLAMMIVGKQSDFSSYYPFYKQSSRSWFDWLAWEAVYFLQFVALEFYFRGFLLEAFRKTMGSTAVFAMAVPYCMIHYGKPYLEANGAIIAGIVLGSLSMKTRSIYAGVFVHVAVAGTMDYMALASRSGIPTHFWP
jgi:membrane protease YdiL (CAAX protease family)